MARSRRTRIAIRMPAGTGSADRRLPGGAQGTLAENARSDWVERSRRTPSRVQGERPDSGGRGRILVRARRDRRPDRRRCPGRRSSLLGGDSGYQYKLLFQTGGQLVPGNQVLVGGQPIGTRRRDHAHRRRPGGGRRSRSTSRCTTGTTAVDPRDLALGDRQPLRLDLARARTPSRRSPTARRIPSTKTTSPVDIDQLFDTLRPTHDATGLARSSSRARRRSTPATSRQARRRPTSTSRPGCSRPRRCSRS